MKKIRTLFNLISKSWSGFWINVVANSHVVPDMFRGRILRAVGLKVYSTAIRPGLTIRGKKLTIEKSAFINYNCFIDAAVPVLIEKKVSMAFGVMVCTSTHDIGDEKHRAGKSIRLPVTIKEGSWVGANSTILPGVTVGKGCIIAAGSVVTKNCEPNGLYAGVPARRIKDLPVEDKVSEVI